VRSGHCWPPPDRCANNAQARKQRDSNLSDQPFVTMGGGALPLPMPTQPATPTATRVATKAMSTFFIGVPLSSRHAVHTSCLAAPLVVRCPQWFTASVDSRALRRGVCPWGHSWAPGIPLPPASWPAPARGDGQARMPRPAQNPRHLPGNPPPTWSAAVAAIKEKGVYPARALSGRSAVSPATLIGWSAPPIGSLWNLLRPAWFR
jgi:hypothetical protein